MYTVNMFLGPRGPHGIPMSPICRPWPPGPTPIDPPMTPTQFSWPHWTLKITSDAFQIIRRPIKCRCWSYGKFYPSPLTPCDLGVCRPTIWLPGTLQTYPLTPWDLVGLPLGSLGPCSPTLWPSGTLNGLPFDPLGPCRPIPWSQGPSRPTPCPHGTL